MLNCSHKNHSWGIPFRNSKKHQVYQGLEIVIMCRCLNNIICVCLLWKITTFLQIHNNQTVVLLSIIQTLHTVPNQFVKKTFIHTKGHLSIWPKVKVSFLHCSTTNFQHMKKGVVVSMSLTSGAPSFGYVTHDQTGVMSTYEQVLVVSLLSLAIINHKFLLTIQCVPFSSDDQIQINNL